MSQEDVEFLFDLYGITSSSSGSCTDRTNASCTSYEGMLSGTVRGVIGVYDGCSCDVVITGGTEVGHSPNGAMRHDNGYKVDLRKSTELNTYITSTFRQIENRPGTSFPQWRDVGGNTYCVSTCLTSPAFLTAYNSIGRVG